MNNFILIENLIKKNQILFLWNTQNINICELFFCNKEEIDIINYYDSDTFLTNYTKLISFFGANVEFNAFNENYNQDNLNFSFNGIFNSFIYFFKKFFNYLSHKDFYKINKTFSNYKFTNQEINLMAKIKKYARFYNNRIIVFNNINFANNADVAFLKK